MSIFDSFGTDENLEKNGVWVNYGEEQGRFLIAHIKRTGSAYSKLLRQKLKPYRHQIQTETIDEAVLHDILVDVFAEKGLLEWQDVKNRSGENIPFSVENARRLLKELPALYEDLQGLASEFSTFKREELNADAKNSESA